MNTPNISGKIKRVDTPKGRGPLKVSTPKDKAAVQAWRKPLGKKT
jgi:hypothetical protein